MKHNTPLSTPRRSPRRHEATTRKKAKFFEAIDNRELEKSITAVCKQRGIKPSIGTFWLRKRAVQGSSNTRRTGK